jgi:hypothetical protein
MAELGRSIQRALLPLCQAHPELAFAVAYSVPREGAEDTFAAGTTTNIDDLKALVRLLVHSAKEVHEQMVDRNN